MGETERDETGIARLEVKVENLALQVGRLTTAYDGFQRVASSLQRHEDKLEDHRKDISAAHKGLERTNEFMNSTRGGMKVLFWVVGLFSGAILSMLSGIFWLLIQQVRQDQRRDDQITYVQQRLDDYLKEHADVQPSLPSGAPGLRRP